MFRATSELVLIDVVVIRKKTNTPAPALAANDLRIFEEDAPQRITFISRDELPLSMVMLFDLTDSDRPVMKHLASGARSALMHLKPQDEVAVMDYAGMAQTIEPFTTDRDKIAAAIGRASDDHLPGGALFNEAMWQAADCLARSAKPSDRRVIIWLTDNLPNVPAPWMQAQDVTPHSEKEAIEELNRAGVAVMPLLCRSRALMPFMGVFMAAEAPLRPKYPPGDARRYAELTGGDALGLRGAKVQERLTAMIDELRARYTIGYVPSQPKPAGTFCKLHVEISPSGSLRPAEWKVLARKGYYRQ